MSIKCMYANRRKRNVEKEQKHMPPYTMFDTFHMFARGRFAHTSQGR